MNVKDLSHIFALGSIGTSVWNLQIVDGHCLIREEMKLSKDKVAGLIEQINKASDRGAPWPKFTPKGNYE